MDRNHLENSDLAKPASPTPELQPQLQHPDPETHPLLQGRMGIFSNAPRADSRGHSPHSLCPLGKINSVDKDSHGQDMLPWTAQCCMCAARLVLEVDSESTPSIHCLNHFHPLNDGACGSLGKSFTLLEPLIIPISCTAQLHTPSTRNQHRKSAPALQ